MNKETLADLREACRLQSLAGLTAGEYAAYTQATSALLLDAVEMELDQAAAVMKLAEVGRATGARLRAMPGAVEALRTATDLLQTVTVAARSLWVALKWQLRPCGIVVPDKPESEEDFDSIRAGLSLAEEFSPGGEPPAEGEGGGCSRCSTSCPDCKGS